MVFEAGPFNGTNFVDLKITTSGVLTQTTTEILVGTDTVLVNPCANGHIASPDLIDHRDGVTVSYCEKCGVTIVLPTVPGGITLQRVKDLLANLMLLGTDHEIMDESDALGKFCELRDAVAAEEYAFEEIRDMMALCRKLIMKKLQLQTV